METPAYLSGLDTWFCSRYSDYARLGAIEGYEMPELLYIAKDGNVARRDPSCMRLSHQSDPETLLARFKEGLVDTTFTFSFYFPKFRARVRSYFSKDTFAKRLPKVLESCGETVGGIGEKLTVEPRFWKKIVAGSLFPEKNTVLAVALAAGVRHDGLNELLEASGFGMDDASVRDVVVSFLITQHITNTEMIARCLAEYRITNLPLKL